MMGAPPLADGAVKLTVACPLAATADTPVGAPGTVAGVAAADGAEAGPVPDALVAVTVNVYAVPFVRPLTVQLVAPVVVHVLAPGTDVTVYPVMVSPPVLGGAVHDTTDWPLASDVAVTLIGAPGCVGTSTELDGSDGGPVPSAFVAVTENV